MYWYTYIEFKYWNIRLGGSDAPVSTTPTPMRGSCGLMVERYYPRAERSSTSTSIHSECEEYTSFDGSFGSLDNTKH